MEQRSNALMVKMLDSRSRCPEFKTARLFQDQLNFLPFQGRLSEYQEVLETKSKLSLHSGSVVLGQLNSIHKKGLYRLLFLIVHKYNNTKCNPTPTDILKLWRHRGIANHSIIQYFDEKRAWRLCPLHFW